MSANSKIEWTDHTFNPWWGCTKVSPGCLNCYADGLSSRFGHNVFGANAQRRFFGDKHWNDPLRWNRQAEAAGRRARVFCGSMCDVFEDRPDLDDHRARLTDLIDATPHLDWLLLTKRPESARRLALWGDDWPVNVWLGTSVEDQKRADERISVLMRTPAAVRFLSCEPLLGPLDLWRWEDIPPDWIIIGGESGHSARHMDLAWAEDIVVQCRESGAAPFVKQLGSRWGKAHHDIALFPEALQVREFPIAAVSA